MQEFGKVKPGIENSSKNFICQPAASVEVGDYFCLLSEYEEADKAFWNYDLYYFDLEAGILYYFHSNI